MKLILTSLLLVLITFSMTAQEDQKDISSKLAETSYYKSMKEVDDVTFIGGLRGEKLFNLLKPESDSLSEEVFRQIPPLHPSRLERRMKILYGLDITKFDQEDLIYLGNQDEIGYTLYDTSSGLIWVKTHQENPAWGDFIPKSFPLEKYVLFYQYLMYNDTQALEKYYEQFKNTFGEDWDATTDFIQSIYKYSYFFNYNSAIEYVDNYNYLDKSAFRIPLIQSFGVDHFSNQKLDAISIYIQQPKNKNRVIGLHKSYEDKMLHEIYLGDNFTEDDKTYSPLLRGQVYKNKLSYYQSMAAWLNFFIKLDNPKINKKVVKFLYGIEEGEWQRKRNQEVLDRLKRELVTNDYFGYTVLREFFENPLRETPTVSKLGLVSARAKVKETQYLLLEPSTNSYEIDTIRVSEKFRVFEMGHDNYYLIEIEKPVESPIAGSDGYAIFDGRIETVRGYLPKEVVYEISDQELLDDNKYTNLSKSKLGVIIDPDGHTNIRSEQNINSTTLGVIKENENFYYWETNSNWYVVQTKDSIRGYVYKNRIKEKIETGDWTLD